MNTIKINSNTYSGNNIVVRNGKVIVDGKDVTPDSKEVNIVITGNVEQLNVDTCNRIDIIGDVNNVSTQSGDVKIKGEISGSVSTMSGDIDCKDVGGSISTMSGDIKHKKSKK